MHLKKNQIWIQLINIHAIKIDAIQRTKRQIKEVYFQILNDEGASQQTICVLFIWANQPSILIWLVTVAFVLCSTLIPSVCINLLWCVTTGIVSKEIWPLFHFLKVKQRSTKTTKQPHELH